MRSRSAALALVVTGSVLVAGCAADVAAGPQGALQERLDRGVAVEITLEADPAGLDDPDAAAELQEMLDDQAQDGPLLVASRSGDGVARGLMLRGGDLEVRLVDETAYLRADADALEEFTDGRVPTPDGSDESAPDGPLALLNGLDGGWVGISGLTEERLADLAGGDEVDDPTDAEMEAVEELLAERDLDDLDGLLTSYATVTGDGPWQVEVHARDLAAALEAVGGQAEDLLGIEAPTDGPHEDGDDPDHDLDDLPERVGGITVEAVDGVATRVVVDLATAMEALEAAHTSDDVADDASDGPDAADRRERLDALAAADARLVLTMVDVGDRVDTPADASVVDVELLESLLDADGPGGAIPGFPSSLPTEGEG